MTSRDWLILIASVSLLVQATFCVLGIWGSLRMNRAAKRLAISNGRTIEDQAHEALLLAVGACGHTPDATAPGCACQGKGDL
jgi:hypothetical protein